MYETLEDEQQAKFVDRLLRDACKTIVSRESDAVNFWDRCARETPEGSRRKNAERMLEEAVETLETKLRAAAIRIPTTIYYCNDCQQRHRAVVLGVA
jgi:hypothetical protein